MKDFKLLAIRPRKGCYPQLLKNLSGEQLYPLYSSFTFYNDKEEQVDRLEGEISTYRFHTSVPKRLYELPPDERGRYNDIRFNLSAIAGKNGSGKSSLIDLFLQQYLSCLSRKIFSHRKCSTLITVSRNWRNK